jgi:hypothetical protein
MFGMGIEFGSLQRVVYHPEPLHWPTAKYSTSRSVRNKKGKKGMKFVLEQLGIRTYIVLTIIKPNIIPPRAHTWIGHRCSGLST